MWEGDGDGGVVGVGGRMELRGWIGVAWPLVGVRSRIVPSRAVLHTWVLVVWRSMLLDVVWMVGVRTTQHQPPA